MTTQEIQTAIADITQQLKGPMSNIERRLLVEDRKDLRVQLADAEKEDRYDFDNMCICGNPKGAFCTC